MNQTTIAPLAFVPRKTTNAAILAYLAALVMCNIVYLSYALEWQWWIFGIVEVCGFFYFSNVLSKAWIHVTPMRFTQKLFWTAFALRVAWAGISYLLYQNWTGTAFSIDAGDELFYDDVARYAAGLMREGNFRIYDPIVKYSGDIQFSDMG